MEACVIMLEFFFFLDISIVIMPADGALVTDALATVTAMHYATVTLVSSKWCGGNSVLVHADEYVIGSAVSPIAKMASSM